MATLTHEQAIDQWIREAVSDCADFGALVRRLPGVYPADVALGLERLGLTIPMPPSEPLTAPAGPIPHPADSDWRFDAETCETIPRIVDELHGRNARVTLIGCPSLFVPLQTGAPRRTLLVEANPAWQQWFRAQSSSAPHDLIDLRPVADSDVVVADPPWYLPEYCYFLSIAGCVARPGACLLLAWPSKGTRPGLETEWSELLLVAEKMGWRYLSTRSRLLGYQTPWFEAQALIATGLPVLANWRRGDLAIFTRTNNASVEIAPPSRHWQEARHGRLELRALVDRPFGPQVDPRLRSIVEGDVLPSVSRRHPARRHTHVWTAGNRVFSCARPDLLLELVATLADGLASAVSRIEDKLGRHLSSDERHWCGLAADQLVVLETTEARDYGAVHALAAG